MCNHVPIGNGCCLMTAISSNLPPCRLLHTYLSHDRCFDFNSEPIAIHSPREREDDKMASNDCGSDLKALTNLNSQLRKLLAKAKGGPDNGELRGGCRVRS